VADGSYSVTFTIYDAATGGNNLWTETQSVTTAGGLFTVLLGLANPVPDSAFQDTSRHLGVKVGADPEMTPRQKLTSVGYAYESAQWTSAGQNLFRLNGNVGIGTSSPAERLTVAGSMEVGTNSADYQHLRIGGGNSSGFLYGSYPRYYDGIHLGYNYYANDAGSPIVINPGGATSRLSLGYGEIGMYVGGFNAEPTTLGIYVNLSGKVGIGTNNPQSPLVVQGASNWGVAEVIGNDGFNNEASIGFRTAGQTKGDSGTWVLGLNNNSGPLKAFSLYAANGLGFGSQAITVLPSGNVGIGANSPVNKLDVEGGAAIGASFSGTNVAPSNGLLVQGSVGIGTASPAAQLHVHDPTNTSNGSRLALTQAVGGSTLLDGLALIGRVPHGYLWNYENGHLLLGTNGVERMRIDSVGNTGIGINTPTAKLQVGSVGSEGIPTFIAGTMVAAQATNPDNWTHMAIISGSLGQSRLNFGDGANDDQGTVGYSNAIDAMFFTTAAAERMRITSTGNVGIGTTTPQGALDVNSTTGAFIVPRMTTAQRNALTPVNGMIIYNTDAVAGGRFEFRENGAWVTK
jgi:hypothetical protein